MYFQKCSSAIIVLLCLDFRLSTVIRQAQRVWLIPGLWSAMIMFYEKFARQILSDRRGAMNLLESLKPDRPLVHLHLWKLTVTNSGARGPLPQGLANVLKRAIIDTAIFVGFTCLDELRMTIRFNGGNCPI
ncbi:hypothetical protein Aduo_001866 [Ancylostoma duodenale]